MTSRDMMNLAILIVVLAGLLFAAFVLMKTPRNDRNWKEALSRPAVFLETQPGLFALDALRDYQFAAGGEKVAGWRKTELDAVAIKEMWFFVEPFPGNRLFGHSFLSFVFDDGAGGSNTVSVSIEARMEKGESYSPLKGVFRNYELMYVWSTEKDIMTRIAVSLDHTLYAYKVDLEAEQMRELFLFFVRRTNALAERPRFYNTLHSNCTNELAKAVNEAFPKALPWHRSWVMTGRSAKWLYKLGFIDKAGSATFRELTARSDVRSVVQAHADAPAETFDALWRGAFNPSQSAAESVKTP
jgi:hypothetical protein